MEVARENHYWTEAGKYFDMRGEREDSTGLPGASV